MPAIDTFSGWVKLMSQINAATYYIKRAEKLATKDTFRSIEGIYEFLGYFRGALNDYAKCFVSAGKGMRRLDSSRLFRNEALHRKNHDRIIVMRHKYVAHNDFNEIESVNIVQHDTPKELVIDLGCNFCFPFDRLFELRDLIKIAEVSIVDGQEEHLAAIAREIGKPVKVSVRHA